MFVIVLISGEPRIFDNRIKTFFNGNQFYIVRSWSWGGLLGETFRQEENHR